MQLAHLRNKDKAVLLAATVVAILMLVPTSAAPDRPDASASKQSKSQAEIRASLITKHNFKDFHARHQKDLSARLPKPFVVTAQLSVAQPDGDGQRHSRSYKDSDGHTVVEGIRVPDDEGDKITWRNGRVINNVFVPGDQVVQAASSPSLARQPRRDAAFRYPSFNYDDFYGGRKPKLPDSIAMESERFESVVAAPRIGSTEPEQARDYSYRAGSTKSGRPVYYVAEEPDSLHADHSPYTYEPADSQDAFSGAVADYTSSGIAAASQEDFIIREHTYTMCPGCPTFSIPVPVPKVTLKKSSEEPVDYQYSRNKTFLEKMGDRIVSTVQNIQNKALSYLDPLLGKGENFLGLKDADDNSLKKKIDEPVDKESRTNYLPMVVAGAAALALGGFALAGSAPSVKNVGSSLNARSLPQSVAEQVQKAAQKYEALNADQ